MEKQAIFVNPNPDFEKAKSPGANLVRTPQLSRHRIQKSSRSRLPVCCSNIGTSSAATRVRSLSRPFSGFAPPCYSRCHKGRSTGLAPHLRSRALTRIFSTCAT